MNKVSALLTAILVAFAAWSGWWWFGATAKKEGVEGWLAERRGDGWAAEADVRVTGYPNRFDMVVTDMTLADPEAGWAWTAPEFRTYMLAYEPNRVIAEWPGIHQLASPEERVRAAADSLRASAAFAPDTALALQRSVVEIDGLELRSDAGWAAGLGSGQLSVRLSETERGRANAYDAVLEGTGLRPPPGLRRLFGRDFAESLPPAMERVRVDLTAAFPRPLDRHAVEESALRPETVWLRGSEIAWGDLRLEARGRLDLDAEGVPSGSIDLRAENWEAMLDAGLAAGALDAGLAEALKAGLGMLALLSGDRRSLEAPLRFQDGWMFLGPVPLGEAPRL